MDDFEWPTTYYMGLKWDAPFTDHSTPAPDDLAATVLAGGVCVWCEEPFTVDDDVFLAHRWSHTECYIRAGMGDVPHLEGRCSCAGGDGEHDDRPYRETAKATVQWLIDNKKGRFHD